MYKSEQGVDKKESLKIADLRNRILIRFFK